MAMVDFQPRLRDTPSPKSPTPTFNQVLNGTAPAPYSQTNFKDFLSKCHCLENLEFHNDTMLLCKRIEQLKAAEEEKHNLSTTNEDVPSLSDLLFEFKCLVSSYIEIDSPKEINIPSKYRNELLQTAQQETLPCPHVLSTLMNIVERYLHDSFIHFVSQTSSLNNLSSFQKVPSLGVEGLDPLEDDFVNLHVYSSDNEMEGQTMYENDAVFNSSTNLNFKRNSSVSTSASSRPSFGTIIGSFKSSTKKFKWRRSSSTGSEDLQ
ncbi:hypothetical protein PP7435_CHR4-0382 [Komagataella phaffii CBS 7435]|uniref:RGS domain-containing protein n=2 Tax=Komagataella phaffii TaxID=460519 RepID=C4R8C3_KOMPG|nr:Hypothetical protein PAS_chr4_0588 [Komagataella phaffii GS115]AOA65187.1 GQ67_04961T0 [Komagataella phaffii]CAH2450756.1 hypothetical protein BQ9382_C4-1990 [Komagataella phaffii CBS 7435]AOA69458.1 GQ68_04942T0 [Komagataella phaffii GS115]CAY71848.1 Hypothetical protein PAS_chr4_0588 [Komagataella phaffii GS115]CCA40550.1 hypothetical protein PP7435_CHR4-0382 [Komagataella phaffii CBS 7435]